VNVIVYLTSHSSHANRVQQTVLEIKDSVTESNRNHGHPVFTTLLLHQSEIKRGNDVEEKPEKPENGQKVKPNAVIARKGTKQCISQVSHYMLSLEK